VTDLVAVGTKPAGNGRWGQSDLAGNVYEWTLDVYGSYVNPCMDCACTNTDCADIATMPKRVSRGGHFNGDASRQRTVTRNFDLPTFRSATIGVRCARAP
jgi:formylglycine-generating enzyme required for sulfatase activity